MTMYAQNTEEPKPGRAAHHAREGSHHITQAAPYRMPAGGWIAEVAPSENWRTTTIVQRHRDRASPVPSS